MPQTMLGPNQANNKSVVENHEQIRKQQRILANKGQGRTQAFPIKLIR